MYPLIVYPGTILLGAARMNMGSTADQAIGLQFPGGNACRITQILVHNPLGDVTAAVGGMYSDVNKGGITVVAATQTYSNLTTTQHNVSGSGDNLGITVTASSRVSFSVPAFYLHLDTGATSAATLDFYVYGVALPNFDGHGNFGA